MANQRDRDLGMDRAISRRDFLHGAGAALAAGMVAGRVGGAPGVPEVGSAPIGRNPAAYPPLRSGLRGSHPGSFEVAHRLALEKRTDWGPVEDLEEDVYDLVVVGAGASGLAAAWFYRREHPDARILLLENHDDFGGHAKRNEFQIGGRTVIGYGGSQSMEAPSDYSGVAKQLLRELGVDNDRFYQAYDREFYRRNGLAPGFYFDRARYGVDRVVRTDLFDLSDFLPMASSGVEDSAAVQQMPISDEARGQFARLLDTRRDHLPDHSMLAEPGYLATISYRDFLAKHVGVTSEEALGVLQDLTSGYFSVGIDGVPALYALGFGMPGSEATSMAWVSGIVRWFALKTLEPYIFHFPDGNASIARLLVRGLIPGAAPGETMEDIVTARFDYAALDTPGAQVRLRLNSTAVNVEHEGSVGSASQVAITYVRNGRTGQVRARHCVLACYNRVIPHLCPSLPAPQKQALTQLVKTPLIYTSVLLRNWRAWKKLGIGVVHCPGSYHAFAMLDFPVSLGDYRFSGGPDDPILVHMSRVPLRPGLPPAEQFKAGRMELLQTPFESMEREIRTHLGGMLGGGGFDPARDIAAITVNRWPHGYARDFNPLFDPPEWEENPPWVQGRKRFGRITIANSDAGGDAYLNVAIDQAHRAVQDLGEIR
jgi:spermidine dehydrogenase